MARFIGVNILLQQLFEQGQRDGAVAGQGMAVERVEHGHQAADVAPPMVQQVAENIGRNADLAAACGFNQGGDFFFVAERFDFIHQAVTHTGAQVFTHG